MAPGYSEEFGRRYLELIDEVADLDAMIAALVDDLAPDLISRPAIDFETAAQLLLTDGDNADRLHAEAGFAALCGVRPVPASSGKTQRHRLNRGGNQPANSALHIIAIGRLSDDCGERQRRAQSNVFCIPHFETFGRRQS